MKPVRQSPFGDGRCSCFDCCFDDFVMSSPTIAFFSFFGQFSSRHSRFLFLSGRSSAVEFSFCRSTDVACGVMLISRGSARFLTFLKKKKGKLSAPGLRCGAFFARYVFDLIGTIVVDRVITVLGEINKNEPSPLDNIR